MRKYVLIPVLALALMIAAPVCAQEAPPPDNQLQQPQMQTQAPANQIQVPTEVKTGAAADPCPAPKEALDSTPDDLAKVQEEIDRFTLCVQRAQLVERLNESAIKNLQANDAALGLAVPATTPGMPEMMPPGMAGAQRAGFPALPANALAGADVSPLPPTNVSIAPVEEEEEKEREIKEWTIREIFGSGSSVQAKLLSPEGDEVRARSGMKLPDGKTTVVRITPAGVTVRIGKATKVLEWSRS